MYSGSDWIERQGKTLSPLGREVADILGQVYEGIYHISRAALHERVKWDDNLFIMIVVTDGISTFDFNVLTRLVILCHDRAVRLEINSAGFGYLRLFFSQRVREGSMTKRHPTMEQAIAEIRERIGMEIV